ncbi:MAG: phosphoribosylanthranilate isomerase [Planctomycetota bacterium]
MHRTRIKICGVRDASAALAAAEAGADAVGLVFVEKSPRHVGITEAARIVAALPPFVVPIGLFANASPNQVLQACEATGIYTVQLHGHETPQMLDELVGLRVIKALPFSENVTQQAAAWSRHHAVRGLLIDTPPHPKAQLTGGSGEAFDWDALSKDMPRFDKPVLLAGGLNADNVAQAVQTVRPFAVDVSSGVESARGVKDIEQVKAFCDAVRGADG